MPDESDRLWVDSNDVPTERLLLGGQEVIVHFDDIPETDITTVDGIRVTTPLRTVIDIAPGVEVAELERIVQDCLDRRLFTGREAWARLEKQDMLTRPGAELLRRVLPR